MKKLKKRPPKTFDTMMMVYADDNTISFILENIHNLHPDNNIPTAPVHLMA
jgi:hypothetical protein